MNRIQQAKNKTKDEQGKNGDTVSPSKIKEKLLT